MRCEVKPGKVVRCPCLMALWRVDRAGLNMVPWRNAARSALEVEESMVLQAKLVLGLEFCRARVVFGARGIFQSPLVLFRGPLMMMVPSLMIWTLCLVRMAAQSLSHNCPMEMREPVLRPGRMWQCWALAERWWFSWRCA